MIDDRVRKRGVTAFLLIYAEYGSLVLGLAGWTAWSMCQEVILAWLRAGSRSIWPPCVAHAGNNFVLAVLTTALLLGHGAFREQGNQLLVVLVLAVVAAVPFARAGRSPRSRMY